MKRLLSGFAGESVEIKAATVHSLSQLIKTKREAVTEENMVKIVNIALIYLKEPFPLLHRNMNVNQLSQPFFI